MCVVVPRSLLLAIVVNAVAEGGGGGGVLVSCVTRGYQCWTCSPQSEDLEEPEARASSRAMRAAGSLDDIPQRLV